MAKKARPQGNPKRDRTYIRDWRKHRGVTLEQLSEMLLLQLNVEISDGQLSRIERGESPYMQDNVEAIALVLRVPARDLLHTDPKRPTQPLDEFLGLTPERQRQALRLVHALDQKTGTDG